MTDVVCIPRIVLRAKGLGPAQARVYEMLWASSDREAWDMTAPALVWVGAGTVAQDLGRPRSSVERAFRGLLSTDFVVPLRDIKPGTIGWVRHELTEMTCQCRAVRTNRCACRVLIPVRSDPDGDCVAETGYLQNCGDGPRETVGTSPQFDVPAELRGGSPSNRREGPHQTVGRVPAELRDNQPLPTITNQGPTSTAPLFDGLLDQSSEAGADDTVTAAKIRAWWDEVYVPARTATYARWRPDSKPRALACSDRRVRDIRSRLRGVKCDTWTQAAATLTHVVRAAQAKVDRQRGEVVPYKRGTYDTVKNIDPDHWLCEKNFESLEGAVLDSTPAEGEPKPHPCGPPPNWSPSGEDLLLPWVEHGRAKQ